MKAYVHKTISVSLEIENEADYRYFYISYDSSGDEEKISFGIPAELRGPEDNPYFKGTGKSPIVNLSELRKILDSKVIEELLSKPLDLPPEIKQNIEGLL